MHNEEDIPGWVLWMLLAFAVLDIVYAMMSLYLIWTFYIPNAEGQGCRASRHTLDPLVRHSDSGGAPC